MSRATSRSCTCSGMIWRDGTHVTGHGTVGDSEPIVYIDHSDIREGALEELKAGVQRLVEFIEARETQLITYSNLAPATT
jgi:hypothetical protein